MKRSADRWERSADRRRTAGQTAGPCHGLRHVARRRSCASPAATCFGMIVACLRQARTEAARPRGTQLSATSLTFIRIGVGLWLLRV